MVAAPPRYGSRYFEDRESVYMVLELADHQLARYLRSRGPLPEPEAPLAPGFRDPCRALARKSSKNRIGEVRIVIPS